MIFMIDLQIINDNGSLFAKAFDKVLPLSALIFMKHQIEKSVFTPKIESP